MYTTSGIFRIKIRYQVRLTLFILSLLHSFTMTLPDLVHTTTNEVRFSLASCVTEDSIDSVPTPLDASPPPPPSNTFPIINIINDDPLPNSRNYPAVASTFTTRRRAQTSPRPVPTSIMITIPAQQPTIVNNNTATLKSKFWPRFKRMMMGNKVEPVDASMKQLNDPKTKRWPSKNRSRVGPQR
jgi:hypothetical protein